MKIVLATPLYPPDIADPAPYVKELAKRLSSRHEITIVTYGHIPEKISGVKIVTTDKRKPLLVRLIKYGATLVREARGADVVYAQNGPSVELPVLFVSLFTHTPIILHFGDSLAHERAASYPLLKLLERFTLSRAKEILHDTVPERPEIISFKPRPVAALNEYEIKWDTHLKLLEKIFIHV